MTSAKTTTSATTINASTAIPMTSLFEVTVFSQSPSVFANRSVGRGSGGLGRVTGACGPYGVGPVGPWRGVSG
jgi:hypothetical protein